MATLAPALLAGCIIHEERSRTVLPAVEPLTVPEIIELSRGGIGDEAIKRNLARHGVVSALTTEDILLLKQNDVSDAVIEAAIEAPVRAPQPARVIHERRVYYDDYEPAWMFGLGALFGYAAGHHGHYGHYYYHYRGHGGVRW
ncbi:MAG: hypothetical protein HY716_16515 [Planctomycetes bacterium]|nr:hypothetical protein [Planctomycetota bacterium]